MKNRRPEWLLAGLLVTSAAGVQAQDASADAVIGAGLQVLRQIDQSQADATWDDAAPFLKARTPRAALAASLTEARKGVGEVAVRTWASVTRIRFDRDEPGTPAGLYANIDFSTRLKDGRVVFELVSLQLQPDGSWRFTGYIPRQRQ